VSRAKNQQALRQLKYSINRGVECDLYTAQGFEALSGAPIGAINGGREVEDADHASGIAGFAEKSALWQTRRGLARLFWAD
jgi:enoyl-CoA hydratase